MREGWYLMSTDELEQLVAAWRSSERDSEFGVALSVDEALAIRDAGNVPNEQDRSLRLVLFVDDEPLESKRLRYEPDYHAAPLWRREGSRPVNIVPLRTGATRQEEHPPWWELPRIKELEEEWERTGAVAGVDVPAEYRSFVFKTVIALRDAGEPVTRETIAGSIARWLSAEDTARVRSALKERQAPD